VKVLSLIALACCLLPTAAKADDSHVEPLTALARDKIQLWLDQPRLIQALRAQNARTANFSEDDIQRLDQQWRSETDAAKQPLIKDVLGNDLSAYLREVKEAGEGLYTEIFVMDAKGLNVGQSDITSDYWQGDEAKWQQTYAAGANAIHISGIEHDESSQAFQSQVSLPVLDPNSGEPIGAITVGIDVEQAL
jgi:hypothetical protein